MEDVYGNQITNYLNHQYYFNGEPVPMWESNYYFMETFNVLGESAGYNGAPLTTYGFVDLAAEYPGEEFATYGDFLVRQAEETIQSKCILCMHAEAEGITLSDESYAQIDKLVEDYRNYVAQLNITLEDYLKISLGPDIDRPMKNALQIPLKFWSSTPRLLSGITTGRSSAVSSTRSGFTRP